jgi:serine/threonine-protein kinase SRPK3
MTKSFGKEYLAAKVLTADVTRYHYNGYTREEYFLELIKQAHDGSKTHGLPVYCEHFEISGSDGPHICIVMHIIGNSLSALRKQAPSRALPVHLVRSIISQLVNIVAKLHSMRIMHTGTYYYVTQQPPLSFVLPGGKCLTSHTY